MRFEHSGVPGRLASGLGLGAVLRGAYGRGVLRGTFVIELPAAGTVRALALAGFDFVVIDLEHSPLGIDGLPALLAEAHACGLPALVRPWSQDAGMLGKLLDLGASGLLVPQVADAAQARAVVEATRYAPVGARGVCPLVGPAAAERYSAGVADGALILLQIETGEGLANAAEIAGTAGIDGVFVGPYDLSQALGASGEVNGPAVLDAADRIAQVAPPKSMLSVYVDDPAESQAWAKRGYRLQCLGFDARMLVERGRAVLDTSSGVAEPARVEEAL
jgi:4-hydroxy-2-oxoheptanedioate aldolase